MKSTVAPYNTKALCLRIVCRNGTTIRLTRYPTNLIMSNSQVYLTESGHDFSAVVSETSFAAAAVDLEGFVGLSNITRDQISSGVFDAAECYLFACDFLNPVEDYEPITKSILGKTLLEDDRYKIEEMGLIDLLHQSIGETYTPSCRKEFGGTNHGGCKVNVSSLTVSGSITSISNNRVFTDSSRAEAADYFGWGTIQFTSGANTGLRAIKVRDFAAGQFTLVEEPYYPLEVGVTYTAVPGCRKRLEDCRDKFNNVVRFGGFPWVPTSNTYRDIGMGELE